MMKFLYYSGFYVDAIDRPVPMATSGVHETLAIINRYPIDLELTPGASFTERTTYTGIYNISGLGFDMSFRVQCSENYYGSNCTTFCEPQDGVYTCDSDERVVCLQINRDSATNCATCLTGWDIEANCSQCLPGRDICTNCATCLPRHHPSIDGRDCLPNVQANQLKLHQQLLLTLVQVNIL